MDVNVDLARVNFNPQCHRWVAACRHSPSIGVVYALAQALGPNPPTVYGDSLARAATLGDARERRVTLNLEGPRLVVHSSHRPRLTHTIELSEALDEVLGRR